MAALVILLCAVFCAGAARAQTAHCAAEPPPSEQLPGLFQEVQLSRVFQDSKTFPDMVPDAAPGAILAEYQARRDEPGFDLAAFVHRHFSMPAEGPVVRPALPGEPIETYIARLWDVLRHRSGDLADGSSLLPLPHPYVVPGGRFRELYYWDSYFTMLGLERDGRHDLALDMLRDFAFEIDCYGHVPNGNRSYYLSRSQPPFFSLMVELMAAGQGDRFYLDYLPELQSEYDYWMDGTAFLKDGQAYRHVVRLADGTILNRYWDDRAAPRDESYREDVETARSYRGDPGDLYRNLRAAAESGWDFSSRWLADGHSLDTIRTVSLLPVDLNCLLAHLERALAHAYRIKGEAGRASQFEALAARREAAIRRLMWNEHAGMFTDYAWQNGGATLPVTAAGLFPLFFHIATAQQAKSAAETLRRELLMRGGLATTLTTSGQQWDQPNGWAPLQWVAVVGLNNYGETPPAVAVALRWVCGNLDGFRRSRILVEKYNVLQGGGGGGGEYALQVGFGWTNGVFRALTSSNPKLARLDPRLCASATAGQ